MKGGAHQINFCNKATLCNLLLYETCVYIGIGQYRIHKRERQYTTDSRGLSVLLNELKPRHKMKTCTWWTDKKENTNMDARWLFIWIIIHVNPLKLVIFIRLPFIKISHWSFLHFNFIITMHKRVHYGCCHYERRHNSWWDILSFLGHLSRELGTVLGLKRVTTKHSYTNK